MSCRFCVPPASLLGSIHPLSLRILIQTLTQPDAMWGLGWRLAGRCVRNTVPQMNILVTSHVHYSHQGLRVLRKAFTFYEEHLPLVERCDPSLYYVISSATNEYWLFTPLFTPTLQKMRDETMCPQTAIGIGMFTNMLGLCLPIQDTAEQKIKVHASKGNLPSTQHTIRGWLSRWRGPNSSQLSPFSLPSTSEKHTKAS